MRTSIPILSLTIEWLLPLAWAILWGVFRGVYAHGGFVWWQHVHHIGLTLLALFAFLLHWRRCGPLRPPQLVTLGATSAGVLVVVTWLSFQTGLALHQSPASVSEFLFDEP